MKRTAFLAVCSLVAVTIPAMAEVVTYDTSLASPDTNPVTNNVNSTNLSWYNGTGYITLQGGWTVATGGGIELGLAAVLRQTNGVIDSPNGVYYVPSGTQVDPPAESTNPARDAWNYQFSIDLNPGGNTTALTFSDVTASLQITNLNTSATFSYDPTLVPDDSGFGTASGTTLANRTAGVTPLTEWGAQNSENPLYGGFAPSMDYDFTAPDTYQIQLTVSQGMTVLDQDTIDVQVTPEPSTWILAAAGFAAVWLLRRRLSTVSEKES